MLKDDARGVGEPLDEVVCVGKDCQGLTVKIQSQYYLRALSLPLSLSVHLLIAIVIIPNHLQARGTYYVNVEKIGHGAHWRRTYGQQVYSPFLLAFTHEVYLLAFSKKSLVFCVCIIFQSEHFLQEETEWKSYSVPKASMMDANYSLPDNVAIVTLQVSL